MNQYALFAFIITWLGIGFIIFDSNKPEPESAKLTPAEVIYPDHTELELKIDRLGTQLGQVLTDRVRPESVPDIALPVSPPEPVGSPVPFQLSPGKRTTSPPQVTIVRPTPQQNADYEMLNAQLDDPAYLAVLNLETFAKSGEVQSLPEALQTVLIQKALDQYNNGGISPETFLGVHAPHY